MPLQKLKSKLEDKPNLSPYFGEVIQISASIIKVNGLQTSVGDIVKIKGKNNDLLGVVSSIDRKSSSIMPFESIDGCRIGDQAFIVQTGLKIGVSQELIGRVVNPMASPIDSKGDIKKEEYINIVNKPIKAMNRGIINEVFPVGVKSIDGLLTCGKGQKMGIFAGSGVGKSSLIGMIVKGSKADIKVIALIGERGREVPEFISKNLGNDLTNTIIVVATSDDSALMRKYGAFSAMAIAEYFKNQGMDVLFIMDSITRFAMAQREIGLSLGEPPTSKGYPPSAISILPQLMERAGKEDGIGSITAFFTVLVEGDDLNDPIADQSRSILDGHIVLKRELSEFGIYPPIDILSSSSRVMNNIIDIKHKQNAIKFRKAYSLIKDNDILIKVGSYQKGIDVELDNALEIKHNMEKFLQQDYEDIMDFNEIYFQLNEIFQ